MMLMGGRWLWRDVGTWFQFHLCGEAAVWPRRGDGEGCGDWPTIVLYGDGGDD